MNDETRDPVEPPRDLGPPGSRYAAVSRRAFLARSAGLAAAVVGMGACAHNDAEVFARGATTAGPAASVAPTTTARGTSTTTARPAPTTAPAATTSPSSKATTTLAVPSGAMAVRFTYRVATTGGRVNNPYVAVWIEDSSGELVDTLGLWYLQSQKGTRWLNELRRWSSVDGSEETIDTISSATRTPGDYAVVWKLTDSAGAAVAPGPYFVCIEASREHGPYSLIRQPFTLGAAAFTTDLPSQGELTNASIAFPAG